MRLRRRRSSVIARTTRSPEAQLVAASAVLAAGAAAAAKVICGRANGKASDERKRRYRLELGETPKQGISRVARGQLDLTIGLLEAAPNGDGGAEAVHEARKALKRVRALLRVSRPVLDDRRYRRENVILRDAGRELSDTRDAQVLLETLDSLCSRFGNELPPEAWSRLRAALARGAEAAKTNVPTSVDGVLDVLSDARTRVSHWPLPNENGRAPLAEGFERIYRRGRRALGHAQAEASAENLHELRKRAKDLWHAAQLLEPVCPAKLKRVAKDAHRLSNLLGDDHDLSVLLDYAQRRPELVDPGELELLQKVVELHGSSLRRQGLQCAAALYRHKPKRALQRLALR